MTHIAGVAARHGLLLWEDCAQVFTGLGGYLGHQESDATFFSFGVIKRATALGGGVARVRDAAVLSGVGSNRLCTSKCRREWSEARAVRISVFMLRKRLAVVASVARGCWVFDVFDRLLLSCEQYSSKSILPASTNACGERVLPARLKPYGMLPGSILAISFVPFKVSPSFHPWALINQPPAGRN